MQTLRKFNKNSNIKKKIIIGIYAFLIIGIILTGLSYAVYQKEEDVLFINATVGEFKENDIELAIKLDGEQVDTPPTKDNYTVTVDCDNADGVWLSDGDKWGTYIDNIRANKVKCEVNFITPGATLSGITAISTQTSINLSYTAEGVGTDTTCKWGTEEGNYTNEVEDVTNTNCSIPGLEISTTYYYQVCAVNSISKECKEGIVKTKAPLSIVEIGDYIGMTPTSTSYTPFSTGYTGTQNTLNPSELNLWRVIKKNDDGTVDVVSEYVSSKGVYFQGKTGYMNIVGVLNKIVAQYTNTKYVSKTRYIGYTDQIETCSSSSTSKCPATWDYSDGDLLSQAGVQRWGAYIPGGDKLVGYWYSGRDWNDMSPYDLWQGFGFKSGGTESVNLTWWDGSEVSNERKIRPVLTFKSTVEISDGDGKSAETAYQLA